MTIIFSFAGGSMGDTILLSGEDRREAELKAVETYYAETAGGEVGRRFLVPSHDGFDEYEIVLRLKVEDRVIIRAVLQASSTEIAVNYKA